MQEGIAVLGCVALGGFHPLVTYCWTRDGNPISCARIPVQYTTQVGHYSCKVTTEDGHVFGICSMDVIGMKLCITNNNTLYIMQVIK